MKLITFSDNTGTWGKLYDGDKFICYTLERPWLNNKRNISCIPAGRYAVKPIVSPRFGETYYLHSLDDKGVRLYGPATRTHILIHKGNTIDDTAGCIVVGTKFGVLSNQRFIMNSKIAFDSLMDELNDNEFELEIIRN